MRGFTTSFQRLHTLCKHHRLGLAFLQPEKMGRTAMSTKAEAEVISQCPSTPRRSKRRITPTDKQTPSLLESAANGKSEVVSPATKKASLGCFDSPGQQAATASAEAPQTPDEPKEKKKRQRNVRLARTDIVAASIPQQVAAVATLPTQSGQHTFEEAPVAVWSRELMRNAMDELSAADSVLAPLIKEHDAPDKMLPTATDSAFHALAHVIMGQQLSVIAARNIAQKVKDACGGHEQLEPAAVLALTGPDLLACGLSRQKLAYITDLAERFHCGSLQTKAIVAMGDEELYKVLTAVKGIGRWSVDMFAMFHCGRLDILPVGDLGVRKGFQALYKLKAIPSDEEMEKIAEKWRPYRSLGSYYMWRVPTQNLMKGKPGTKKKAASKASAVPNTE